MRARLLTIVAMGGAAALGWPTAVRAGQATWRIAREPAWVVPAPASSAEQAPADASVFAYLLDDTQVRVSAKTVERYLHIRLRPRSPAQVESGSQVQMDFDPAYERLVIHHARVERDGRAVATLAASEVKVVQREQGLDERIYDGRLSALIFLHDVRVGDVVDFAYTVEGGNPALGGKYVTDFSVADQSFTASWRCRILLPEARSLTVRNHGTDLAPAVTTAGGWRVYTWERRDVPPIEPEDGLPSWFNPAPSIEASEFASWAEVAAFFVRAYADPPGQGPELAAQIARLRALPGTTEDRVLAATRFVQDDIRYLGIELGLGGHQPFTPSSVLERRFGDCKDKSVLLVTLLRALGLDARPALVNTVRRRGLDDVLPSPKAFNHAIVQVVVDGQSRFIDATASYQRGPLSARQPPDYERALIVAPDTRGLVPIPRPRLAEPAEVVHETLTISGDHRSADLDVETTLFGDEANRTRALFATRTRKEITRNYLNYYSKEDPSVTQTADLQVADDERRNVVTVREGYHFGEFWRDGLHQLDATQIVDSLKSFPRIRVRRMPYAIEFPLDIRFETRVRFPVEPRLDPEMREVGDDHLHFRFESRVAGRELLVRYELQSLADVVPPAKAQRFFQVQDEILRRAGYVLRAEAPGSDAEVAWFESAPGIVSLVVMSILPFAALGFGARAVVQLSKRRRFKKRQRFASGETPATAIEAGPTDDLGARIEALGCDCGVRYRAGSAKASDTIKYDGRTLAVWAVECGDCHRRRSVFFTTGEG